MRTAGRPQGCAQLVDIRPPAHLSCRRRASRAPGKESSAQMSPNFRSSAVAFRLRTAAPLGAADSGRSVPFTT